MRNLLVHEAVHAISDMKAQDIFLWQTEFFAYATSALVSLARDPASFSPSCGLPRHSRRALGLRARSRLGAGWARSPFASKITIEPSAIHPVLKSTFYYNSFLRLKEAIKTERPYILGWWKKMPTDGI